MTHIWSDVVGRLRDDSRQHCNIQPKNQTLDKQRVVIENVEENLSKRGITNSASHYKQS